MPNKLFAYEVYKKSYALTQKTTFQKRFNLFYFIKLGIVGTVNLFLIMDIHDVMSVNYNWLSEATGDLGLPSNK